MINSPGDKEFNVAFSEWRWKFITRIHKCIIFYIHPLNDHLNHRDTRFLIPASMFSHITSFWML